jgi:putative hemolysin
VKNIGKMSDSNSKFIDIEKIIGDRNPSLLRWMPGFVLNYIKRIAHEKDLNHVFAKHGHLVGIPFLDEVFKETFPIRFKLEGVENIPASGGVVMVSNHPLGGIDGVSLIAAVGAHRKDLKFIVNDVLMNIKQFEPVFLPVNKLAANTKDTFRMIDAQFASEDVTLIFPAGLCSRKTDGVIKDLEWKRTFVSKARANKRSIIPVFFEAQNSSFFYNLSNFRKKIGIKANVEMFYLSDEMFRQRGNTFRIVFGKPIPLAEYSKLKDQAAADAIREHVYLLGENPNLEFKVS